MCPVRNIFVFNRLWAAVKREIVQILSEGVSDPIESTVRG
jgi:hypothetical protein